MRVVVVGGHSRDIGKTSVMVELIRGLRSFSWTAVKITQHSHGTDPPEGAPDADAPGEQLALTEEKHLNGHADTCRFLAAGARRSLGLNVEQGHLAEAVPLLRQALEGAEFVMIESNSVLGFLNPVTYVVVLDSARHGFMPSAHRFLAQDNALVPIESGLDAEACPMLDSGPLRNKRLFPVSSRDYFNPELRRFIQRRVRSGETEAFSSSLERETRSNRGSAE